MVLLPRKPRVIRHRQIEVGPERVDVEPAAPCVSRIDSKAFRLAFAHHIHEDFLDALLVKPRVFAVRNDVPEQTGVIDRRATYRICTLPQSGWPVTGQFDFSRFENKVSSTGDSPCDALNNDGSGV